MTSSRGPINRHVNRRRSMKRRVKSRRRRRRQVPSAECRSFARSRAMEADPTRKNATLRRIATAWRRLVSYMFRPEDGECLAVLRIAFGESIS